MEEGADELDFVINYETFKKGSFAFIKDKILTCTQEVLNHNKTIKWIIEIAAFEEYQTITITQLIKETVLTHFDTSHASQIFIKTSTGFSFRNSMKN